MVDSLTKQRLSCYCSDGNFFHQIYFRKVEKERLQQYFEMLRGLPYRYNYFYYRLTLFGSFIRCNSLNNLRLLLIPYVKFQWSNV